MKSMTGYGNSRREVGGFSLLIEMKSVNGRHLALNVKIPRLDGHLDFENIIGIAVKKKFSRGSFDVYFSLHRDGGESVEVKLNEAVLPQYSRAIDQLRTYFQIDGKPGIDALLGIGDLIVKESHTFSYLEHITLLEEMVEEAIGQLAEMRDKEGSELKRFFDERLKEIESHIAELKSKRQEKVGTLRVKLVEQLKTLFDGIEVDENRLVHEAAIQIDKSDIQEELTRLELHVAHFRGFFGKPQQGKKMEFLLQEMNREINTIGSKGGDFGIAALVIEVKSILETMREQILNVE